jgi:DNA-binding GntR family transcriptional regulator
MAAATPSRLLPLSLRGQIVNILQRAILSGAYQPGDRLIERQLAADLGVSPIPIREALQELESRGLVSRFPNRGCQVTRLTAADLEQIFKFRSYMEPMVVQWAGENMTEAGIHQLQRQLDLVHQAAGAGDLPEFFYQDLVFHRILWDLSGNRYAARALEMALGPFFAYGLMSGNHPERINLVAEAARHQEMLDALRRGEPEAAAETLLRICEGFERHIRARPHDQDGA